MLAGGGRTNENSLYSSRGYFLKHQYLKKNLENIEDRMESIIEHATIIQKNGVKKLHDAIRITDKGIYTGELQQTNDAHQIFKEHSFIPHDQIKKISVINKEGKYRDIDL